MSLKDRVRPILPPTSRAFMGRADELLGVVLDQSRKLDDLSGSLEAAIRQNTELAELIREKDLASSRRDEELGRQIDALRAENGELRGMLDRLTAKFRYTNLEYAAKRQGSGRILVAGWYGAENFGDELMLRSVLESLPTEALDRVSVLLWDNYLYPDDALDPRVTVLHYPISTWDLDQLAESHDALVWGGGAIIDDRQYTPNPENFDTGNLFIRLSRKMLARGKEVWCLGLSSNDHIESPEYARELDQIVRGSALFSLRDPISLQTLREAGVDTSGIVLCEDLAFASPELTSLERHVPSEEGAPLRLAFVPLSTESQFDHYVSVLDAVDASLRDAGRAYEIVLVPFLNEGGHDMRYCQALIERVACSERMRVAAYTGSVPGLELASFDLVITYKYHAALIALVQGTPTLCVFDETHPHYRNKMTYLTRLLSYEKGLAPSTEFEKDPVARVDSLLADTEPLELHNSLLSEQRAWLTGVCHTIFEHVS